MAFSTVPLPKSQVFAGLGSSTMGSVSSSTSTSNSKCHRSLETDLPRLGETSAFSWRSAAYQ